MPLTPATNSQLRVLAFLGTAPVLGAAASAQQLHDTDMIMGLDGESRIVLTDADGAAEGTYDRRVFVGLLDGDGTANDPGWDSFSGTLPGGTVLRFDLVGALRVWNGAAFPEAAAPSPMSVFKFGQSVDTPTDDSIVEGLPFGQANAAGRFHHHVTFELTPPLVDGVYLLGMQLVPVNTSAVLTSETFWLVWDFGAEPADVMAAEQWAVENLAGGGAACLADWDQSDAIDIFDILGFLSDWNADLPETDLNNSGSADIFDVLDFLATWSLGCP